VTSTIITSEKSFGFLLAVKEKTESGKDITSEYI